MTGRQEPAGHGRGTLRGLSPFLKFDLLLVVALLLPVALLVQTRSTANDTPATARAEITTLVRAWIDAEVEGDRARLERILHEDFVSTFASGKTVDRDAYIDIIVGLDIEPFSVINESMHFHDDTVVVIDVDAQGETKFTWTAKRYGDEWRVIAQTFTTMQEPG